MGTIDNTIRLLVVDDDEVDRLQLKRALKGSGLDYKLTECDALDSQTEALLTSSFDCIFLDYLMPGNNGLLLLKKIRDAGVKTPVVIITSQGNERVAVELMKAGASDYVVKNNINGQVIGQVLRNMLKMGAVEREREAAIQALRVSESRLAEAQRIAKIGNWELTSNSNNLFWSNEVYRLFNVDPEAFHPTVDGLAEFITPVDRPLLQNTLRNAKKNKPFNIDLELIGSKVVKHVNMQGHALEGENDSADKIVGTLQDITERKLAEEELMKAREVAEQSMKTREIFLANMSHEIRTPMNAILGFTRLLYKTSLTDEQKSFLDAINFSGENLLVIINDILDLTKIQSGKLTIDKTAFSLPDLVRGIVALLEPKAREKNLQFTYRIDNDVPPYIYGDAVRLNQVLTNLISNATKFTASGSLHVEIKATMSNDREDFPLTISVRDTGIGIPGDKQSKIFESFEQASTETTRKYGGTGLGLSIVKALVELQGGSIKLISNPGSGSVFTVTIPYHIASPPNVSETPTVIPASLNSLKGSFILLVEDNELNSFLATKVLSPTGCILHSAKSGKEAVSKASETKYGLILMDIQMPEMDGFEATKLIRGLPPPFCDVPIIAMTAHAFDSDVVKCISAGMNDYISKPFKPDHLIAKVIEYLGKSNGSFKKTG
jgi:signal transduction histidine kinase/DNA-binding response OmpR family regulator